MPFIEEEDLLNLHKDVEKAQTNNEKLLDQIKYKNKDLRKIALQRNIFVGITILLVIGMLLIIGFGIKFTDTNVYESKDDPQVLIDSLEAVKAELKQFKSQNEELADLKEFYLAETLLKEKKIYTVQVMAFADTKTALTSEGLSNSRFVKNNPFYSYSLGNFTTLQEAQAFRKQLVKMGFKDAFIASYRNGKRIKIEEAY